ncbi:MAG: hypothetical protein V4450_17535 [Bacteroidota bacterium]
MRTQPAESRPVWVINEDERRDGLVKGIPFANWQTQVYYQLMNRLDTNLIEVYVGHTAEDVAYHNDVRQTRFDYIGKFYKREKVYFTFDRITIYELIEILPDNPRPIRFMLKRIENRKPYIRNRAFMIMPFAEPGNNFYKELLRPFLKEEHSVDLYRADDFSDNDIIIETIIRQIEEAEFIIADTTLNNKNAFYELGYAAALGKDVITIQDYAIKDLFFDRSHIRTVFYEMDNLEKFRFELSAVIKSIRARQ